MSRADGRRRAAAAAGGGPADEELVAYAGDNAIVMIVTVVSEGRGGRLGGRERSISHPAALWAAVWLSVDDAIRLGLGQGFQQAGPLLEISSLPCKLCKLPAPLAGPVRLGPSGRTRIFGSSARAIPVAAARAAPQPCGTADAIARSVVAARAEVPRRLRTVRLAREPTRPGIPGLAGAREARTTGVRPVLPRSKHLSQHSDRLGRQAEANLSVPTALECAARCATLYDSSSPHAHWPSPLGRTRTRPGFIAGLCTPDSAAPMRRAPQAQGRRCA